MDARAEMLGDDEFGAWGRLVSESPDGSVYSLPEYLDVLCQAAGGRFRILGVRGGDELVGGVALYERDSRFGPYVAPRRLLHYNGLVLRRYATRYPSEQTSRHLSTMSGLVEGLARTGYAALKLNCASSVQDVRPFVAARWAATPQYTYVVPIQDLEALWTRMEHNVRRLIRRCEREGTSVVADDDFDTFYRLHATTMQRISQPCYLPEAAFRRYFETLRARGMCRLFHARLPTGRTLASQLVLLGVKPTSHTVAAAADPEFLQTGVSAFLRFKVFGALAEMGFSGNDLTDASLNPVTHFKAQLGGDLRLFLALEGPRTWAYRLGHGTATALRRAFGAVRRTGGQVRRQS